jgi:outer membrane protein assembly factor BamE (lipoprotein component of BamABCDE complex)
MKKLAIALVLGFSVVATGCAYKTGTEITQTQVSKFHAGTTTKSDILAALGTPQELKNDGADQWMVYNYNEISSLGANKNESTTFVIGTDGVLKQVMKGQGKESNPLLQ